MLLSIWRADHGIWKTSRVLYIFTIVIVLSCAYFKFKINQFQRETSLLDIFYIKVFSLLFFRLLVVLILDKQLMCYL